MTAPATRSPAVPSRPGTAARWSRAWGGRPPHPGMLVLAGLTGILMAVPLVYVVIRAAGSSPEVWAALWRTQIPRLLVNSLSLALLTTILALAVAVPMAWLVTRTDLPGRRLVRWLAALPLVFPAYVGAFAYLSFFGPRGVLALWLSRLLRVPPAQVPLPNVYGLGGAALVIALFTYPYVYLLVAAALGNLNRNLEDAARLAGLGPWAVFRRVTLPLLKPAVGAGAMLVGFHALADYGTVAMFRYDTFTHAIFMQLSGRYDRSAAAALSLVLVALTLACVVLETRSRMQARFYQTGGTWRPPAPVALGPWKWPALAFVGITLLLSIGIPFAMVVMWTLKGLAAGTDLELWRYTLNSVVASGLAATLALGLAFPVAYLTARTGGRLRHVLYRITFAGYALPGVVVALALVFLFNRHLPWFYNTIWVLVAAYLVRFMPECLSAQHAVLAQISPNLEEAARSHGFSVWQVLWRITLPLALPGFTAGWCLVFLNALKELEATWLVRPAGYDTLAVRVWNYAAEGFNAHAGPPALLLILLAVPPLVVLAGRVLAGRVRLS